MPQQKGAKRATKVLKRKQKQNNRKREATFKRQSRGAEAPQELQKA
jgi:hypothetical protein